MNAPPTTTPVVSGNRVFVSCSPNLIVYTDENGDDKPDKKEILLTGFGGLMRTVDERPDGVDLVVGKPLTRRALREALAEVVRG